MSFQNPIPALSHIEEFDECNLWVTIEGNVGVTLELRNIDPYGENTPETLVKLKEFIKSVDFGVGIRITSKCSKKESFGHSLSRKSIVERLGYLNERTYISFELYQPSFFNKSIKLDQKTKLAHLGNQFKSQFKNNCKFLSKEEVERLFLIDADEVTSGPNWFLIGPEYHTCLRLKSINQSQIGLNVIADLKSRTGDDFELILSLSKINREKQFYKTELKKSKIDHMEDKEALENLDLIEKIENDEEELIEADFLLVLKSTDLGQLIKKVQDVKISLAKIGKIYWEQRTGFEAWLNSRAGSLSHRNFEYPLMGALFLSPFLSYNHVVESPSLRSLAVHNIAGGIEYIDLFSKDNKCANTIVSGKTGGGKSFLLTLLKTSHYEEKDLRILEFNIGSSGIREAQRLKASICSVSLDKPSGLNPFIYLNDFEHSNEICMYLSKFMETLFFEEGDRALNLEFKNKLSQEIIKYSESRPKSPCLTDFYAFSGDFCKKDLLNPYLPGGIYQNLFNFSEDNQLGFNEKYRFIDFPSISTASNRELMKRVFSAFLAIYNSDIYLSGKSGPRYLTFLEETKYYFQQCKKFISDTFANSRKLGHGICMVNQESGALSYVNEDGVQVDSIHNNTSHRFIFGKDGSDETFMEQNHLNIDDMERIKKLEKSDGKEMFRDVFYKNDVGSKILRTRTTPEEYWSLTTTKEDTDKLYKLMENVEGLTLEEAQRCLAVVM